MSDTTIDLDARTDTPARETAVACLAAGIEAARPERVVREALALEGTILRVGGAAYDLAAYREVVVLGGGKAAARVAAALETLLGDRIDRGVVVTDDPVPTDRVEVVEGSHPVPDERGAEGARRVLELAGAAEEETLVLAVIAGGGSALLPAPAGDLTLEDLQGVTDDLLRSGADIGAINAVRKHASALKGGRLARAAAPATVVGLVFSDVVGDNLATIASGPTAPDPTTYGDALAVLDRHDIDAPAVREHLRRGRDAEDGEGGGAEAGSDGAGPATYAETPDPGDPAFDRVDNHVLANAWTALRAAREAAAERGYEPLVLSSRVRGEASEAALTHLAVAEEVRATGTPVEPPAVVLSGGELTVTVAGDGEGGPSQEFALSAAIELVDPGTAVGAVDTDGRDGATDAAGALADAGVVEDADEARRALDANDAYPYLERRDALVTTGRTGTNVNDLRVLVVEADTS